MNYILGNWKSNKNLADALTFLDELKDLEIETGYLSKVQNETKAIIAPPYPFLGAMHAKIKDLDLPVALAVQDISGFGPGTYTGEVCAENLADLGVEYAVVGHSERRIHCHETHEDIANKIEKAMAAGIKPILCLDEPYIKAQAEAINPAFYPDLIIAFEPLSAISNGQTLSPVADTSDVEITFNLIAEAYGHDVPLLYGGSVSPATIQNYLTIGQGALVGSASLKPLSFSQLFKN